MRTTILFLATSLVAISTAYAVDTAVPGATISTPGSESKGNPIPPPDNGMAGKDTAVVGQTQAGEKKAVPGGTISTPGSENKGNPIPAPQ